MFALGRGAQRTVEEEPHSAELMHLEGRARVREQAWSEMTNVLASEALRMERCVEDMPHGVSLEKSSWCMLLRTPEEA